MRRRNYQGKSGLWLLVWLLGFHLAVSAAPPDGAGKQSVEAAAEPVVGAVATTAEDPYRPNEVAGSGVYKGRPMSTARRPIAFAEGEPARPGDLLLANLNHGGTENFVIASVPVDKISDVIMQTSSSTVLGHTQFRISFSEPVLLYHQPGNAPPKITRIHDIVYSVDAALPEGVGQVTLEGMIDNRYPRVHRFMSQHEDFYYRTMSRRRKVRQFRLKLTPEQKKEFFTKIVNESRERKYQDILGLCFGNCTSEGFAQLDSIVKASRSPLRWIPPIPWHQEWFLNVRNLVEVDPNGKVVEMPSVNEEFQELAKDPELRERFREELRAHRAQKHGSSETGSAQTSGRQVPDSIPIRYRLRSLICAPILSRMISRAAAAR